MSISSNRIQEGDGVGKKKWEMDFKARMGN